MSNYIIYHTTNPDEINECSYSLLKYLDVYNLKPPPDHKVIIYTTKPAMLESFGSYCVGFELHDAAITEDDFEAKHEVIKNFSREQSGNILYLASTAYPVKDLAMLFSNMNRGTVYGSHYPVKVLSGKAQKENISVLGFNTKTRLSVDDLRYSADLKSVKGFIEEYAELSEFRILLKEFFKRNQEESIPNLVKMIHNIDARSIQEQKKQFQQLPLYKRMLRKMLGRAWDISQYASKLQ